MTKKSLMKKVSDLSKYLKSEKAKAAIHALQEEIQSMETAPEKSSGKTATQDDFETPKEVAGKSMAVALYTDGACRGNPGPGSYAYIVQDSEGAVIEQGAQASSATTNNKMELTAIIEGLKSLSSTVTPMHEVYVYTDSKYVVDGMKSWVHNWKKRGWKKADNKAPENVELWKELDQLSQNCHVFFNWVKGHAGHPQNEYVDQMANDVLDENGY